MVRIDFEDFLPPTGDEKNTSAPASSAGEAARHRSVETAVRRLPPLPAVLHEVLAKLRDGDPEIQWLESRISSDPSLATRILKMANSSFYRVQNPVVSLTRAFMTLGLRTVTNLFVASSMRGVLTGGGSVLGYVENGVLLHSLGVAVCAQRLGRQLDQLSDHREALFMAGLLHDVGQVALGGHYARHLDAFTASGARSLSPSLERSVLGVDHLQVGQMVWEHWKLPDHLLPVMTRHHEPPEDLTEELLTLAVVLVDLFLDDRGFGRTEPIAGGDDLERVARFLGTDLGSVEACLEGFEDEVSGFLGALA